MSCEIQRIPCGNVNCYLVSSGTDAILVDTGREKDCQTVLNACKPFHVRLLVLTHGHVDHAQNAAFLAQALNCPVAMHKADLSLLSDNRNQPLYASSILGRVVRFASIKSFERDVIPAFTPAVFLTDGDSLERYGIPAAVVGLPGHTDGSIGLDVGGTDLIVGDALMNMFYPTVSMLYHDRNEMLQSAGKIGGIGPRTIHFGHGKPVKNRNWLR